MIMLGKSQKKLFGQIWDMAKFEFYYILKWKLFRKNHVSRGNHLGIILSEFLKLMSGEYHVRQGNFRQKR